VIPEDLRYSASHEWVRVEDDLATIGITDHAQSELGDIVYLELPKVGATVQSTCVFGTIESVKTVSDLTSPVSGDVVEVNDELPDAPELVNEEPYSGGWMIIVKMESLVELDELMTAEQYENFIQER
jgi:glycine cleavage system H protein